jgi:hypothetical protein
MKFGEAEMNIVEIDGKPALTAEQLGLALDYSEPRIAINKILNRNYDEFVEGEDYTVTNLVTVTGDKESVVFFKEGAILIAMFSNQPRAKAFRAWAKKYLSESLSADEEGKRVIDWALKGGHRTGERIPVGSNYDLDLVKEVIDSKDKIIELQAKIINDSEQRRVKQIAYPSYYRTWKAWDNEENATLRRLQSEGKPMMEIAAIMERSVRSVKSRWSAMQIEDKFKAQRGTETPAPFEQIDSEFEKQILSQSLEQLDGKN